MIPPSKMDERGPAKEIRRKINEVIGYLKSLRPAKVDGQKVKHTALGTINVAGGGGDTSVVGGPEIQRFKIMSIADNWVVCRKVDKAEAETSATDYKVMRPLKLRKDGGLPSDYTAATLVNQTSQTRTFDRTINGTNYTVAQEISPPYAANDFIYGSDSISGGTEDDGAGTELTWIDLNVDGRHWEYSMRELGVCVDNAVKKAIAQISEGED